MSAIDTIKTANELARLFYGRLGYVVPEGYRFDKATHPQEVACWYMAIDAYELLEDTQIEDVLEEAIEEGGLV